MKKLIFGLTIAVSLFLFYSPASAQTRPLIYFEENNIGVAGGLTSDFPDIFIHPEQWVEALSRLDVYQLRLNSINFNRDIFTPEFLTNHMAPVLHQYNIKLSLNSGVVVALSCRTNKQELLDRELDNLRMLRNAGLTIESIAMQSILEGEHWRRYRETCPPEGYTLEHRIQDIRTYINAIKPEFPDIKFGIWDSSPARKLDWKTSYQKTVDELTRTGHKIDFIQQDNPAEYFNRTELLNARNFIKNNLGLAYGITLTSETSGQTSNQAFHNSVINFYASLERSGLNPDYYIVTSWYPYPNKMLPENSSNNFPQTKTLLTISRYIHGLDTPSGYDPVAGGSTVEGAIDRVTYSNGEWKIKGWACLTGVSTPIRIHVYAGGPAGSGSLLAHTPANQPNETAVNRKCNNYGGHRFSIPVQQAWIEQYQNQPLYIYAISGYSPDINNSLIDNSGAVTLSTTLSLPGDLNGDGRVDIFDFNLLVSGFGNPYTIFDYNNLVGNFGK